MNRLACAQATGNSAYNLAFSYNQDGSGQYGNMTCSYNSYTSGPCVANTFNGATNQINSSGYSYDAAGNVLTDGTYGYTWDAEGRMASESGSGLADTSVYNALGQAAEGYYSGGSSSLVYDPSGQWIGQYNSAGYWWGEYVRLGGRVVAFNSQSQGITVFLHKDMQTTTHMATGPDGSVLQDQIFYPSGQSWYNLGTWYQQEFAGLDMADPSTGFYDSLSRTYTPPSGRWLTPDPAGLAAADPSDPQTWNMYAYVRNNPTTLIDPTGLASGCPIAGQIAGTCGAFPWGGIWNKSTWDEFTLLTINIDNPPPDFVPVSNGAQSSCPGCYYAPSGPLQDQIWDPSTQQIIILTDNHSNLSNVKAGPTGPIITAAPIPQHDKALTRAESAVVTASCAQNPEGFKQGISPGGDPGDSADGQASAGYAPRYSKTGPRTEEVPMGNPEATGAADPLAQAFTWFNQAGACKKAR